MRAWGTEWAIKNNGFPEEEYPDPKARVIGRAGAHISQEEMRLYVFQAKYGGCSPWWGRTQSTTDARQAVCTKDGGQIGRIEVGRDRNILRFVPVRFRERHFGRIERDVIRIARGHRDRRLLFHPGSSGQRQSAGQHHFHHYEFPGGFPDGSSQRGLRGMVRRQQFRARHPLGAGKHAEPLLYSDGRLFRGIPDQRSVRVL